MNEFYNNPYMHPPVYGAASPSANDATIFEKRLEHDQIIFEVYKVLSGRSTVKKDGKLEEVQVHKPLMNPDGVSAVISLLRSTLNPVTGLTNISDEHASALLWSTWRSLLYLIVLKQEEYHIDPHHKQLIMASVITILHCQLYRGVGGHESRNIRTQTSEVVGSQQTHITQGSSGMFNFGSSKEANKW